MADLRLRITKCYLVEVIDKEGNVQEFENNFGQLDTADDYCFGTKADAEKVGKDLIKLVERDMVK